MDMPPSLRRYFPHADVHTWPQHTEQLPLHGYAEMLSFCHNDDGEFGLDKCVPPTNYRRSLVEDILRVTNHTEPVVPPKPKPFASLNIFHEKGCDYTSSGTSWEQVSLGDNLTLIHECINFPDFA